MIVLIDGKNGSGKTFHAVKLLRKKWKRGVNVYTNTQLNFIPLSLYAKKITSKEYPQLFNSYQRFFTRFFKKTYFKGSIYFFQSLHEIHHIQNGIIFFDEASGLFSARGWESLPDDFANKLQEHRKSNLDLYATTPHIMGIDVTYRRLIHYWFHTKELIALSRTNPITNRRKIILGLYRVERKDVTKICIINDEQLAETEKTSYFFIGLYSKKLYDTAQLVIYKKLKTIILCLNGKIQVQILPKKSQILTESKRS